MVFCWLFQISLPADCHTPPSLRDTSPVSGEEPVPQALPLNQGIFLHGSPLRQEGVAVRPRGYAYASSGNVGCATSFNSIQLSKIKAPPEAALRPRRGLGRAANSVPLSAGGHMSPHVLKRGVLAGQSHCRLNFFQSAVKSCLRHPQFRPSLAVENVTRKGSVTLRKPAQDRFDHIGRRVRATVAYARARVRGRSKRDS